ncbi:hypothetical protein [Burkholderia phage BCSR5]|nr:hypothetical protein [Burkholderia phage BCSR5]
MDKGTDPDKGKAKKSKSTKKAKRLRGSEIKLTKIKQWIMPRDAVSYKVLRRLGLPYTKFHERMMPTLKLLMEKKGVKASPVQFQDDIFEPFTDKVIEGWERIPGCKALIKSKSMTFVCKGADNFDRAQKAKEKLEECLDRFFRRWGYTYTAQWSEGKTTLKLYIEYVFSNDRMPELKVESENEVVPETILTLGRTRLVFKFGKINTKGPHSGREPEVTLKVEISQGGQWNGIHTSHCLYCEISNVMPAITALANVLNQNPDNMDVTE